VGQYPFAENKVGHLTEQNHEKFKNKMVDIIDKRLYNTIIDINYEDFKL
jgi:phosphoribosylformylglycinamidine (FGAM) synthase PurS component